MSGALNDFLGREAAGSPIEARQRAQGGGSTPALNDFLAREAIGSPIEAREMGGPVNGLDPQVAGGDAMAYPRDVMEQHARLVRWFEEAERATTEEREASERDRDYYCGIQWTKAEMEALRKRGQPDLTINYVSRKVDLLCGIERRSRTDPKAFSRTPTEDERADAATQALRYVGDQTNFPVTRSSVYENMIVEGFGGAELGLEDDGKGGANVTITHVPWDRIFRDPHSRGTDFLDARYKGLVLWMDEDQILDVYPDAEHVLVDTFSPSYGSFEDKPGQVAWRDNQRKRCRVVQIHWVERGDWWSATITRAGYLSEPHPSPFKDSKGRSACPLVLQSAFIDRENRRYGMVRDLISLQDEINKRRSKALHLLSVNRVIAAQGAVDNVDKARREAAKPDGYIEVNGDYRFEILTGQQLAQGQFELLQHATQEMQASGPNASMAGNDPRQQSGRAILAQQAGGAAQNEPLTDALRQWSRRVYEMAWMAVREFWTGERWVRVTDDLGAVQWVGLNRRITYRDELASLSEVDRAKAMVALGMMPDDPRLMQVRRVENDITDLMVDIVIEEGQDVPALQAEQFQALTQLAGSQPGLIPGDVLIAASQLRNKGELLERMKAAQEAQGQTQQQQAQMMQQAAQADVRGKHAQAAANEALAAERQGKAVQTIAQVHKIAAESPSIPVEGPGIQPNRPQQDRSGA